MGENNYGGDFFTHVFFVRTEGGASKRTVWIDQIAAIRDLSPRSRNQFTIQLKDGTSFDALYVKFRCEGQAELDDENMACSSLVIQNPDESTEHIDMRKLKSIEFLPAARKDRSWQLHVRHLAGSLRSQGEKLPAN